MSDIFAKASKQKLRFPSNKGELTVEQLWDLPLQSKSGFDLDSIAKEVNRGLKATAEESFVATTSNPANTKLALQLEIVKFIIADRQAENATAAKRVSNAEEKTKLLAVLEKRQGEKLESLTEAEVLERISKLQAE